MSAPNHSDPSIQRALLSVSDKSGIVELAHTLSDLGVEILSTSGTARLLKDAGIRITDIADYTGFPEIMDGRIKTLHPKVHGALLGRRGIDDAVMKNHRIKAIDLVVVNLYPFVQTTREKNCTIERAMATLDIGGPAMIRSAAKNHRDVTVVVDPADYPQLQFLLKQNKLAIPDTQRSLWAAKAFAHTAAYDSAISGYLAALNKNFPDSFAEHSHPVELRYGENPHQSAAFYMRESSEGITQVHGKKLSYNNYLDLDAAIALVCDFKDQCVCAIIKHTNPCGVASGTDPSDAYARAYTTDPASAFGGIIAFNRTLDKETIARIIARQFVEVIAAPTITADAPYALAEKPNVRLIVYTPTECPGTSYSVRSINGGLLLQQKDNSYITAKNFHTVSKREPDAQSIRDLVFAARVVKHVKSNAIVYARGQQTLGIGAGQTSRIDAVKIATRKAQEAGLSLEGAVLASDAFFPFSDSIAYAAQKGIAAVVQPGGSLKDPEVVAAADQYGLAMVFTRLRNFKH